MQRATRTITVLAALATLGWGSALAGPQVSVGGWAQEIDGSISANAGGVGGTGVIAGDRETIAKIDVIWDKWALRLENLETSSTINGTFTFNGTAFNTGARLDLDLPSATIEYRRRIVDEGRLELKGLLSLKLIDAEATLTDAANNRVQEDQLIPIPQVGVMANFELEGRFSLDAELRYFDVSISDASAKLINYSAGVSYQLGNSPDDGKVTLGWARTDFEVAIDEDSATDPSFLDLEFDGPMLKVQVPF